MTTSSPDIDAVLERIGTGDRGAFDGLVRAFWEPVMRYFWKRVPSHDAQDLAQNVFLSVYRAARSGRALLPANAEGWSRYFITCSRHQLVDYERRKGVRGVVRRLDDLLDDDSDWNVVLRDAACPDPTAPAVRSEERGALRDCLAALDTFARAACWAHFVSGRSKRDIARAAEMPESSLRVVLVKALASLRGCLGRKGVA